MDEVYQTVYSYSQTRSRCGFFFISNQNRKQAKAMKLPDISISVHIEICQKEKSTELINVYSVKI